MPSPRTFQLQQDAQAGCPLYATLPKEIRDMILKLLLKPDFKDGRIISLREQLRAVGAVAADSQNAKAEKENEMKSAEQREQYQAQLQNSAQLLRTCQTLYQEGTGLLYKGQKLVVKLDLSDPGPLTCAVLDEETTFPGERHGSCLDLIYFGDMIERHDGFAPDKLPGLFPSNWHTLLQQFAEVEFDMCDELHLTEMFIICRALEDTLRNTNVTCALDVVKYWEAALYGYALFPAFQYLQATVVDSEGRELSANAVEVLQQRKGEGRDIYALWWSFKDDFLQHIPQYCDFETENEGARDELSNMLLAALENNWEDYLQSLKKILSYTTTWMRDELVGRILNMQARLQANIKNHR